MIENINRIGEKHITNEGYEVEIIEYFGWNDITVKFLNGLIIKNLQYSNIKKGNIKNPYHPSVCGIGYLGEGKYDVRRDRDSKVIYICWRNILNRCYNTNDKKYLTYKGITVDKYWHNFQNFAKWFEDNHKENWHLDKDILVKGNKIYSPETCAFVPKEINGLIISQNNRRGKFLIGVGLYLKTNRFVATVSINGKNKDLGYFDTELEAFQAYKTAKEAYIKKVADRWRGKITEKVYQALINYKIEITD